MEKQPKCRMEFSKDSYGKEILLKDGKFQVMMEWEKPYMEACIDALAPSGDVLEIGFGCGYSASRIQQFNPKSHTIIEFHPEVAERAREFAAKHPHVTIIEETWQNALPKLGMFDVIFFDDYPLESEKEMQALQHMHEASTTLLEQTKALLKEVDTRFPSLKEMTYSDAHLIEFIEALDTHSDYTPEQLVRFFSELEGNKQITPKQHQQILDDLLTKGILKEMPQATPSASKKPCYDRTSHDRFFAFLHACLEHHMRPGARFSCYLSSSQSKYEDKRFYDEVIINPHLEYKEKWIAVDVPPNCDYYTDREALVMTITLVDHS